MSIFNLNNYITLLEQGLIAGYNFIGFHQACISMPCESAPSLRMCAATHRGKILLRHDVDVDLAAAALMAQVEAKLGIESTFFLMWRSPCYNLLSRSVQQSAEKILSLGHHIGLHYDQGFDALRGCSAQVTAAEVSQQADWLEKLLSCRVSAVSFHQPSSMLLQKGVDCGARVNTYDSARLGEYRYISDSNRVFSLWPAVVAGVLAKPDLNALASCYPQNLQLLIHPMWWVYDNATTEEVWDKALKSNFEQAQRQLLATERAFGGEREFCIINKGEMA